MTRISNETLGKVIVQVVKDFEKVAKEQEKNGKKQAEELQKVADLAIEKIKTELDKANSISLDLRPFEEKSKDLVIQIEKVAENLKKQAKPSTINLNVILIYFGTLIIGSGAFYFFNTQAKELKKAQFKNEAFTKFILSDEKRADAWKSFVNEENNKQ
jgi:hypothetical protein